MLHKIAKFNYFELSLYIVLLVRVIQEKLHRTSRKQVCYHKKIWLKQNCKTATTKELGKTKIL